MDTEHESFMRHVCARDAGSHGIFEMESNETEARNLIEIQNTRLPINYELLLTILPGDPARDCG